MKKIFFISTFLFFSFIFSLEAVVTFPDTNTTEQPTPGIAPNDPSNSTITVPPAQQVQNPSYYFPQNTPNYFDQTNTSAQQPAPESIGILNQIFDPSRFGFNQDEPLGLLLNQLFYIGLVVAVILAIIMIIRGGIGYMTIDAIASKENGKKRVQAALGGLVLSFAAILILNTINPGLTNLSILFPRLGEISSVEIESDIYNSVNQFSGLSQEELQQIINSGKIPTNITPAGQKILAQALAAVGNLNTGTIDNTNGGRLACAAAVNKIVEAATGQQVGGGLSTASMYTALQKNSRFQLVPGGIQAAQPGDIILSPTSGGSTGHVGIVATPGGGQIISNSSSQRKVLQNHTASSWSNYYGNKKGLPTYIYRPL